VRPGYTAGLYPLSSVAAEAVIGTGRLLVCGDGVGWVGAGDGVDWREWELGLGGAVMCCCPLALTPASVSCSSPMLPLPSAALRLVRYAGLNARAIVEYPLNVVHECACCTPWT
jgi:hypothetical protein